MNPLSQDHVLHILQELIRIPSINPHLTDNKSSNEMEVAQFICRWLQGVGISAQIEEVVPGRPNVVAEFGSADGPTLCLCGHMDTVDVKEMTIGPFDPRVVDGNVYGRGSCDMKAGVAAILCAAWALSKEKLSGKVVLALVCDEEYASIGADDFVKRHRVDACVLTEPSDLKLMTVHKGFLWGKISLSGKSAHGSRWDLGESAITKVGSLLMSLDKFDREILRKREEDLVGPASMHVSLIEGGSGVSTYASSCTMHIERRTLPSEIMDNVKKELNAIILSIQPDAKTEWYFDRPPLQPSIDEKIEKSVKNAYQEVMCREVEVVGWGVWTDAAIFQQAGVPTVNIGPRGFGLHEPVEWVDLESVVKTAEILYHTAKTYFEK